MAAAVSPGIEAKEQSATSVLRTLVLSDLDLVNGIVSVSKARVAGLDRCQTKTGDDRRIALCPRALAVLKRQLALRAGLEAAGIIRHEHVFFRGADF